MKNGIGIFILTRVKRQSLLAENKPLRKWLLELKNKKEKDENPVVSKPTETCQIDVPEPMDDFRIPEECFYSQYDEDTLAEIMDEQMKMVKLLKKCGKSKHLANR